MHNDISTLGVQDMQIKLIAKEQKIDLSAKIKTTIYDSGNTPITTPI
jgi:hypothetical protein